MKGIFITFEGPEGSGKSTHVKELVFRLRAVGIRVESMREPGGTPLGEAIRGILQHNTAGSVVWPETEAMLFCASRSQLVRSVIIPALKRGKWVVCDRFMDSTTAYQVFARRLPRKTVDLLNAFAVGPAVPDLTILLDIDVRHGFRRVLARKSGHDRFEREKVSFHEKVRKGYLSLARQFPGRFAVVDSGGSVEEVDDLIWNAVSSRLLSKRGRRGRVR